MQIMEGSSTLKGKKKKKNLKHATVTDPRLTVLAPSQANKLRECLGKEQRLYLESQKTEKNRLVP